MPQLQKLLHNLLHKYLLLLSGEYKLEPHQFMYPLIHQNCQLNLSLQEEVEEEEWVLLLNFPLYQTEHP